MSPRPFAALGRLALLVVVVPLVSTVANAYPPDARTKADCDITIEGRHGGASGEVVVLFQESQVRTRVGWWADLARGGDTARLTLRPGQSFTETFRLRLGCRAHRRYRVVVSYEGVERTIAYPSEDGFTQERVIDLEAVSQHFGIPPGDDIEPQPITLDGLDLDGEWIRSESNNDPNDGMRISVDGDEAVMTYVPPSAGGAWREGEALWRDVSPDGSISVRGSDGNYYPAQLETSGPGQLALRIRHGGAGNVQTWVRSGGCWSDEAMVGRTRTPDIWVRYSNALPSGFTKALTDARDAQAAIQTAAISPSGEWVVVAANVPCTSPGFPASAREWIDNYIASGREIDVVAFGPGGRWVIVAEDFLRRSSNVSDRVASSIRRAQERDLRVTSFAFGSHDPDEGFAISAGGEAGANNAARNPLAVASAIGAAEAGQRPVHEIAVAPSGDAWVLVAEDWFVTGGVPFGLLEQLERYRTDERRRIDHVVLHEPGGDPLWALISNGEEPAPDSTDLINLVEHQLTGDSTMYQRMKTHRITGLSMAVVQNNEVAWTRSYGLRRVDFPEEYVYPNTIFDAASISKPVSYAAALQLVDSGDLDLTRTGVLYDLSGGDMPSRSDLDGIRADELHLAHLLNHCAGIQNAKGASGAQEILPGEPLPTIRQIFRGVSPAASGNQIVRVDSLEVGEMLDYSGANSILIQALMEQHARGGYDGQMQRLLDDLGMARSTFRKDFHRIIPPGSMASGHLIGDGQVLTMRHQAYPNQAAAALRTTARDLAQFVILLNQGGMYDGRRLLNSTTVDRFIGRDGVGASTGVSEAACDSGGTMRLGVRSGNLGTDDERYWHGGLHNGFRTYMTGRTQDGGGVVILITGTLDDANALRNEIRAAIRAAYGWASL